MNVNQIHRQPYVICDFDGTVTPVDLGGAILDLWADQAIRSHHYQEFLLERLSLYDLQHTVWQHVRVVEAELHQLLHHHVPRPGFHLFVQHLQRRNIPLQIVSGGFDFYIDPYLNHHDLKVERPIMNRATIHKDGRIHASFPYRPLSCQYCSNCKGAYIRRLRTSQKKPLYIIAIGDGHSDRCMAGEADMIFARDSLVDWCEQHHRSYHPYETFNEILGVLRDAALI